MGTRSITIVRSRRLVKPGRRENVETNRPAENKYIYEYYACVYKHFDGYVEDGVGEWLTKILVEILQTLNSNMSGMSAGVLGARLIHAFMEEGGDMINLLPVVSLKVMLKYYDYACAYFVTVDESSHDTVCMLSVYEHDDWILTARPEKFLKKYVMNEEGRKFTDINYDDDDEVEKGFIAEDQLFMKSLGRLLSF